MKCSSSEEAARPARLAPSTEKLSRLDPELLARKKAELRRTIDESAWKRAEEGGAAWLARKRGAAPRDGRPGALTLPCGHALGGHDAPLVEPGAPLPGGSAAPASRRWNGLARAAIFL